MIELWWGNNWRCLHPPLLRLLFPVPLILFVSLSSPQSCSFLPFNSTLLSPSSHPHPPLTLLSPSTHPFLTLLSPSSHPHLILLSPSSPSFKPPLTLPSPSSHPPLTHSLLSPSFNPHPPLTLLSPSSHPPLTHSLLSPSINPPLTLL